MLLCDSVIVLIRDAVQRLAASVVANPRTKLSSVDLSRSSIEDRGSTYSFFLMYFNMLITLTFIVTVIHNYKYLSSLSSP